MALLKDTLYCTACMRQNMTTCRMSLNFMLHLHVNAGRPAIWGLEYNGFEGVKSVLTILRVCNHHGGGNKILCRVGTILILKYYIQSCFKFV